LPYEAASLSFVIYSILADGKLAAGVEGQAYQFEPGQSWVKVSSQKEESQPDCQITSTLSITNHGLLQRSDITFVDEALLP
jgi:hypothetical protein